jgi:hypothetical protein
MKNSNSRSSGEWNEDGAVVGRIFEANAAPVGTPWMWALAFVTKRIARHHGYEARREAAFAAFAKKLAALMSPAHR